MHHVAVWGSSGTRLTQPLKWQCKKVRLSSFVVLDISSHLQGFFVLSNGFRYQQASVVAVSQVRSPCSQLLEQYSNFQERERTLDRNNEGAGAEFKLV